MTLTEWAKQLFETWPIPRPFIWFLRLWTALNAILVLLYLGTGNAYTALAEIGLWAMVTSVGGFVGWLLDTIDNRKDRHNA